jgi:phosphoglycerate dehydrogenase-like enzyme
LADLIVPLRVAVLDDYQNVANRYADWSKLDGRVDIAIFRDHLHDPDAVVARLAPFSVVCLMRERTPLTAPMLARLPNLTLVVTTGMWNAALDIAAAHAHGIVVCGTRSVPSGTPELTWLLILGLARGFVQEHRSMQQGGWQSSVGADLRGRTLGILGLGKIGTQVARVANAFGMRVLAWSANLTDERAREAGAARVDKDALFREADFVTVSLKLSERTYHVVGARELALMKPSAFLVNTSRGPLVDEAALIAALDRGVIAGAGLDVYNVEPLPREHPFRTLPHVVALPHIGYVTEAGYRLFYEDIVEDIDAWLHGTPLRLLPDPT